MILELRNALLSLANSSSIAGTRENRVNQEEIIRNQYVDPRVQVQQRVAQKPNQPNNSKKPMSSDISNTFNNETETTVLNDTFNNEKIEQDVTNLENLDNILEEELKLVTSIKGSKNEISEPIELEFVDLRKKNEKRKKNK